MEVLLNSQASKWSATRFATKVLWMELPTIGILDAAGERIDHLMTSKAIMCTFFVVWSGREVGSSAAHRGEQRIKVCHFLSLTTKRSFSYCGIQCVVILLGSTFHTTQKQKQN